jgi:hypothetical protein
MAAERFGDPEPYLTSRDIQGFVQDGFVRLDAAFSRSTAEEARQILWRDTGCDPVDRTTWSRPVIRLGSYFDPPFRAAANAPRLVAAIDQLAGVDRWRPLPALGTFPIRFPSESDPGDTGWHVDASYPPPDGPDDSFFSWRVNVESKGRALLLLFLFSDVGELDAPTRIRVGSHLDVARILATAGEGGMSFMELASCLEETACRPEWPATGNAGTVYLCHPFLAHAAQPHRGKEPRFMAQPPVEALEPFQLDRSDGSYSPNEIAVRLALGESGRTRSQLRCRTMLDEELI